MSEARELIRSGLDWAKLGNLRLVARSIAEGALAGAHRSPKRGAGVEFGGHRNYMPGDELRWLDRHALMRHRRLLVRQFETETDRSLRLIVDASASMSYRSEHAAVSKFDFTRMVAAALARIAVAGGDPVGLDWLGGEQTVAMPAMSGFETFERLVGSLCRAKAVGDLTTTPKLVEQALLPSARYAPRGSVIVLISDFFDLPNNTIQNFAALSSRGREIIGVQVLDPAEIELPFTGAVRLKASEGDVTVLTDPERVRTAYKKALEELQSRILHQLLRVRGRFVVANSSEDPITTVRRVLGRGSLE